jgi:PBP1b-binding outer membrane lipoprotein LpoB
MKKSLIAIAVGAMFLTGCATSNYALYAQTQQQIAVSKSEADIARTNALKEIAASGDTAARVAAVMSLQFGSQGQSQGSQGSQQIAAPTSFGDTMLKWASVLVPSLTQVYAIGKSTDVAITHSNNSVESLKSNNGMIVDLVQGRPTPIVGNRTDADGSTEDFLLYPR